MAGAGGDAPRRGARLRAVDDDHVRGVGRRAPAAPWPEHTTELLFRLDHTAIYLAFGGTATPLALLGLSGWHRTALLWGLWGAAAVGIVLEWLPFAPPKGFSNGVYLTMGWATMLLLPGLWSTAGVDAVVLLLVGGAFYTVGAIVVGLRRPDPDPLVFGYHEIWHLFVIAAVVAHYTMVATTLLPLAA
ncbi:MAG: PAQR family membrane homeostasis protein TrhA [Actinomycetes bacterium]